MRFAMEEREHRGDFVLGTLLCGPDEAGSTMLPCGTLTLRDEEWYAFAKQLLDTAVVEAARDLLAAGPFGPMQEEDERRRALALALALALYGDENPVPS